MRILLTMLVCVLWPSLSVGQDAVRARVLETAKGSVLLAQKGRDASADPVGPREDLDDASEQLSPRFPSKNDVRTYTAQRPWTRQYSTRFAWIDTREVSSANQSTWPQATDARALRALLSDADPVVRGLAIEALATLHDPNDIELIARSLDDSGIGAPALGWNRHLSARVLPFRKNEDVEPLRSWYRRSVKSYARVALKLMTGRTFDAKSFASWWPRHRQARSALWFWDERLKRALAQVYVDSAGPGHSGDLRMEVLRTIREELRREPPEVEAKVCLLAPDSEWGLLGPCDLPRLPADRLLDLLDRRNLWEDVEWDVEHYNAMVVQIGRIAHLRFQPEHLKRLQAVMARERNNLWWNGNGALRVAISKLLPHATDAALDDGATREGFLREVMRRNPDLSVRREAAKELVRVDVARSWPFLEQQFFAETGASSGSDLRLAILDELGAPPFTADRRTALARLLLDRRFDSLWTRPSKLMGDDMYRQTAIAAVNAHAGQEVLTIYDKQDLERSETSSKALARVRETVIVVLGRPPLR